MKRLIYKADSRFPFQMYNLQILEDAYNNADIPTMRQPYGRDFEHITGLYADVVIEEDRAVLSNDWSDDN